MISAFIDRFLIPGVVPSSIEVTESRLKRK